MATVKLIHTADVHLDAPNQALGERAGDHRTKIRAAFERVVDLTLERRAQALIIAGDLFDSARPGKRTVDFAFQRLARLAEASPPVEVFVLPGNHDCWAEDCVYASAVARALPEHVHVLGGTEPVSIPLPHLDLTVHGCAHLCDRDGQRPLTGMAPSTETRLNVAVAHGSFERGDIQDDSGMFSAEEIAQSGMDYLALGHWHGYSEHSAGHAIAINPGSPEVLGFGRREPGAPVEVTLTEGGVSTERVPVSVLRADELEIDVADVTGTEDIIGRIAERADPHTLLEVNLVGLAGAGVVIDAQEVEDALAEVFYAFRVEADFHPALGDLDSQHFDPRLALGKFVELARERVEVARAEGDGRAQRIAERALALGFALLQGEEVLK